MSEAISPAPATAESAKPAPSKDFGVTLREARQAAGLDVATLAARLRLHPKQVEALERGDLASLPALIYVRGFLRGCARELKIDPRVLLDDLDRRVGVEPGSIPAPSGKAYRRIHFGDGAKPIITVLLFVLVLAGVVGMLIPRRPTTPVQTSPPLAQEVPAQPSANPAPEATGAAGPPTALQGATPATTPPAPLEATSAPHSPGGQEAYEAPRSLGAVGPSTPSAAASAPASAPVLPDKTISAQHVAADTSRAANGAELVLRVRAEAWIEVMQSDGTMLLSQLCPPGTTQTIKGKEPLHLVIGNPSGVDAQFRGTSVDLSRYTGSSGVARLTLE